MIIDELKELEVEYYKALKNDTNNETFKKAYIVIQRMIKAENDYINIVNIIDKITTIIAFGIPIVFISIIFIMIFLYYLQ